MYHVAEVTLLILLCVLSTGLVWSLWHHQRNLRFAHPGWILAVATIFYGLVTPVTWLIAPGIFADVAPSFIRYFDRDAYIKILLLYVICLAGFLFAQVVLLTIPKRRHIQIAGGYLKAQVSRKAIIVASALLLVGGVYLFRRNYSEVGGFVAFLSFASRKAAFHLMSQGGGFTRYQSMFHSFFILASILVFRKEHGPGARLLAVMFGSYAVTVLVSGTRLEVVVVALAIGFVVFALQPQIVRRHRRRLLVSLVVLFVAFSLFAHVRASVRQFVANGEWVKPELSIAHMFPVEAITGYVPGFIIERVGYEHFFAPYLIRPIPNTLFQLFGVVKPPTLSQSLAYSLHGQPGMAVYTVTLPVDAYVGSNVIGAFVISASLYLLLYLCVSWACRRGTMGIGAGAILFLNTYYVVRVEVGNWVPRMWQDLVIFFAAWGVYKLLSQERKRLVLAHTNSPGVWLRTDQQPWESNRNVQVRGRSDD